MENQDLKIPKTLRQQLAEFQVEQQEKLKLKEIEKTKKK